MGDLLYVLVLITGAAVLLWKLTVVTAVVVALVAQLADWVTGSALSKTLEKVSPKKDSFEVTWAKARVQEGKEAREAKEARRRELYAAEQEEKRAARAANAADSGKGYTP